MGKLSFEVILPVELASSVKEQQQPKMKSSRMIIFFWQNECVRMFCMYYYKKSPDKRSLPGLKNKLLTASLQQLQTLSLIHI